jgi:rubrerythrin
MTPRKPLRDTETYQNLKRAFAGEAQANRRYIYFARQADVEGYPEIAGLFRDTAEGETGHASGDLDWLKGVADPVTGLSIGTTAQNLAAAVAGETMEATDIYPRMAAAARQEGFEEIADWFETLARAEQHHAARFSQSLEALRG